MRLKSVQVQNYRSIVDSDVVEISERVTVIIGKNEQGKTTFLKALTSFNTRSKYTANDLPNHMRAVLEEKPPSEIPIIRLLLEPETEDRKRLTDAIPGIDSVREFEVTRFYDSHYSYYSKPSEGLSIAVEFARPRIAEFVDSVKKILDSLKAKLVEHSTRYPTFAPSKPQADAHIDQLTTAKFSDPTTLNNIFDTFSAALKGLPGQDGAIQQEIATADVALTRVKAQIGEALKKDPVAVFHQCVPHFVFHSTILDKIPNEVSVAEFVKDPEAVSKGMANLCKVAGLSTQKIQELAAATDVGRREAYEDHYRSSISGGINEFWTQETYNVHFRIDKEKLSVTISDNT
jgi:AAA ATPase domain